MQRSSIGDVSNTADSGLRRLEIAFSSLFRHGTARRIHEDAARRAGYDCERSAYLVLRKIVDASPIRITDLAADLGVEPSTVSRQVQPLEVRGWIERGSDSDDARVSLLAATDTGEKVVSAIDQQRRRFLSSVLEGWSSDDREALFDLLERFAREVEVKARHISE